MSRPWRVPLGFWTYDGGASCGSVGISAYELPSIPKDRTDVEYYLGVVSWRLLKSICKIHVLIG